jgi:hypothetical protein
MKRTLSLLTLFSLMLSVSCFEPPQYSIIPKIEFDNIRTVDVADPTEYDSVIVSIKFKDGDGDLGHGGTETDPPFNRIWYRLINAIPTCEDTVDPPCKKISYIDEGNLTNVVRYSLRRTNSNYDTLHAFVKPFSCDHYEIVRTDDNQIIDTVYVDYNPRTFNFFCDIYVKEPGPNGPVFIKYDWSINGQCPPPGSGGFYSNFGVLGQNGDPDLGLPLEGVIKFKIASNTIYQALKNETLKFKIRILDRAGHYSNEVESKEFILD